MKKTILLLAVFILISSQMKAQWSIGGKAGINWSNINYPGSIENPSFLTGINAGAVTSYQINEKVDIQGELLYSSRGWKEKNFILEAENEANKKDLTVRYHYIDIPVVIKYFIHSGFNIHAGPQVGIALSQTVKFDNEKQSNSEIGNQRTIDFGLVGGLGYEYPNGIFIDGRYLLGLNSSLKGGSSFQNRSIQLAIGYKFRL